MSNSSESHVENPSTPNERALASLFASIILLGFSLLQTLLVTIFRFLSSLVRI